MAYIQRNVPPPNQSLNFSLLDFAGGLNNRSENLANNEAENVINMAFTNDSVMEKRKGTTSYDELTLSEPILFIDEFKPYKEEDVLIRATATKVYVNDILIKEVKGEISGTNFQGKYFFADGDGLYVYGKFAQETGTYVTILGTAVDEYKLFTVVNPPSDFVPLTEEHVQGVYVYDYNSNRVWYEPCANEVADSFKGSNVLPEKIRFLANHKGRMYLSGAEKDDDNVFITDIRNPYYTPVYLPIQLPPNSDKVRGLIVYDSAVVVGRSEDVYVIDGNNANVDLGAEFFTLKKLNTHTGFMNHKSVNVSNNYLFFLGSDGNAYALSSVNQDVRVMSTQLLNQKVDFLAKPIGFSLEDLKDTVGFYFRDEWLLSIKEKVLVYNYRVRAWTVYDGWNARSFYNKDNVLLFGNEDGRIGKQSEDYLDFGKPYLGRYESKQYDMGDAISYKQFREFFLVIGVFEDRTSTVRVTFEVDYVNVSEVKEITSAVSRWGVSKYGDRYINRDILVSVPIVIGQRGRYIKFIFSNAYTPQDSVFAYEDLSTVQKIRSGETLVYVESEQKYYLYNKGIWEEHIMEQLDQPMRVYQVNGEYELRGKR